MANFTKKIIKTDDSSIYVRVFEPDEVIGVILVLHGMAEHGDRYEQFAFYAKSLNFALWIPDHRQHGKSIFHDECGIFGRSDTYENILKDVYVVFREMKNSYKNIPVYILGHSMGTLITRGYVQNYNPNIDGVILIGSPSSDVKALKALRLLSKANSIFFSGRSAFIGRLGFRGFNKKIENKRTDFDWLTTDKKIVDEYIKDELCGYDYNGKFYYEFARMFQDVNSLQKMKKFTDRKVAFLYGLDDPVGEYGKGAKELAGKYNEIGKNFVCYEFENMRHEILNENGKEKVYKIIGEFLISEKK